MFKVYNTGYRQEAELLASYETLKEAVDHVLDGLNTSKIFYVRIHCKNGAAIYDYGSHTSFRSIQSDNTEITFEAIEKAKKEG